MNTNVETYPAATPAPAAAVEADPRRWRALPVLLLAAVMDLIDAGIVTLALPSIGRDLAAGGASATYG